MAFTLSACVEDARRIGVEDVDTGYILLFDGREVDYGVFLNYVLLQAVIFEMNFGRGVWDLHSGLFDELKKEAVDNLVKALAAQDFAMSHGIFLTEGDMDDILALAEFNRLMFQLENGIEFPLEAEVLAVMIADDFLLDKLFTELGEALTEGNAQFDSMFGDFLETYMDFIITVHVNYVLTNDAAAADEAKRRFGTAEDGFEVHRDLSVDYLPEMGVRYNIGIWDIPLLQPETHFDELNALFRAEPGFVSDITEVRLETGTYYVIVRVEDVQDPNEASIAALREEFKEMYIPYMVGTQLEQWTATALYEINQAAFDKLQIADLHELF
jgi:hypothetical protein